MLNEDHQIRYLCSGRLHQKTKLTLWSPTFWDTSNLLIEIHHSIVNNWITAIEILKNRERKTEIAIFHMMISEDLLKALLITDIYTIYYNKLLGINILLMGKQNK